MNITVTKAPASRRAQANLENPAFGEVFSDHMFLMEYRNGGWGEAKLLPFGPLPMLPSMSALHYGQIVFEGLKAFRQKNGAVALFRPEKFYGRFVRSCRRLAIPSMGREQFIGAVKAVVREDAGWVPHKRGHSLYLRPFVFASESFLGVRASREYTFMVIASPVGNYYKEGVKPVRLTTSADYIRAAKGGLGDVKTPANYAASLLAAEEARDEGFAQVIWLDAIERRYLEEVGAMNIFCVIGDELVTPPLEGTILPGVTRLSVLELAKAWGIKAVERRIAIDELFDAREKGRLGEVFGSGTAAVISPVGELRHGGKTLTVNGGNIGPLAQRLYDAITAIQYGEAEDTFGWMEKVV
ncbi:MAG: branched-chain amino acid aminotransferase [Nitrospinae bacterium]|nr:branched-chain amino acid aminotransferase [Nitrospinota bacterium]